MLIFVGNQFPCPVGDLQSVEPTLIKRVLVFTHLFHRFKHPADTAGRGFSLGSVRSGLYSQDNRFILFLYSGRLGKRFFWSGLKARKE